MTHPSSLLRAVIVEDELPARARLRSMLRDYHDVQLLGEADSVGAAVPLLRELRPDVLFLDIRLGGGNAFQLLRLMEEPWPQVVFVTAYSDYAVRAFEVRAIDYLLKPFERERLDECVNRLRDRAANADRGELRAMVEQALEAAMGRAAGTAANDDIRLVAYEDATLVMVDPAEIDYIEADRNYVWFCAGKRRLHGRYTLSELAVRLGSAQFSRVHRSLIVNLRRVDSLTRTVRGGLQLTLRDGRRLRCGVAYRQTLLERLGVVRRSKRRPAEDPPP
jgi:two-component system LytT family response regulator